MYKQHKGDIKVSIKQKIVQFWKTRNWFKIGDRVINKNAEIYIGEDYKNNVGTIKFIDDMSCRPFGIEWDENVKKKLKKYGYWLYKVDWYSEHELRKCQNENN